MRTGRPKAPLILTSEERRELESLAHRSRSVPALARRARIVLACAAAADNKTVARRLRATPATVGKWRTRFARRRLAGLYDEPRPGAPRSIGDDAVEQVVVRTLESTPRGATHWSTRTMAQATGLSHMAISRIWRAFGLQPHRSQSFKLSPDPLLVPKVRDIVGLYLNPPEHALVLCVDEKSQIQALDRTAPLLPMRPGLPERQTHDYKRHGTTTLFAAFNILNGKVIGTCQGRHRSREFIRFLNHLETELPTDQEVHLIMDNYCTHKSAEVQRWLKPKKRTRFHFHFTPTSSSWLNQVERFFALITERMIRRGTFHSTEELEKAIYKWLATWNGEPAPFTWRASADVILDKVRRCKELSETGD